MKKNITIILVLAAINLFSYSILERGSGNLAGSFDARIAAMGQSGVANSQDFFGALNNPATLSDINNTFGFSTSVLVTKNSDDRSFPMYNFFDGYVDDATYVANTNFYDEYGFGAFYSYEVPQFKISAGFHYLPYLNFDSNYEEQVRNDENSNYDNYPPIIANNQMQSEGRINALGGLISLSYNERYSLGIQYATLKGDWDGYYRINWTETAHDLATNVLEDTNVEMSNEFTGNLFKIGLKGRINERVDLGFAYQPKITLENDFDDLEKPGRMKFGVTYQPRNIMRTYFNCDAELVQFSDVNDLFDNQFNFYIGVEHQFMDKLPLRLGFNYQNFYQIIIDDNIEYADRFAMPVFSVGTGFNILKNLDIDVSAELAKREYDTLDLFPDGLYAQPGLYDDITPENRGWENPDHVDESFVKIQTTINYKW